MEMSLNVELVDPKETVTVTADARDFREWEMYALAHRPTPLPMKPGDDSMPQTLWLSRICFTAARRASLVPDSWAAFDSRCVGIEATEDTAEIGVEQKAGALPDPTQSDHTPG